MKKLLATTLASAAAAAALALTPGTAHAEPVSGCTSPQLWGFLGSQRRTICDGYIHADGSWMRERTIWVPAHQVPATTNCYGSSYVTCSTYGGYWVDQQIVDDQLYPVTPDTVLPDEPGHLGGGGGSVA